MDHQEPSPHAPARGNGYTSATMPRPPWEQRTVEGITTSEASGPAYTSDVQALAGMSTLDQGEFAAQFASVRRAGPISESQIAAVLDVIVQAGGTDAQSTYLDPMAPEHERMLAFTRLVRPAIER